MALKKKIKVDIPVIFRCFRIKNLVVLRILHQKDRYNKKLSKDELLSWRYPHDDIYVESYDYPDFAWVGDQVSCIYLRGHKKDRDNEIAYSYLESEDSAEEFMVTVIKVLTSFNESGGFKL